VTLRLVDSGWGTELTEVTENITTRRAYFENLWRCGCKNVTHAQINAWDKTVTRGRALGRPTNRGAGLRDCGADSGISIPSPIFLPTIVADVGQAFVKFLGEGNNRVHLSFDTWPTDEDHTSVEFVRDGLHGNGVDRGGNARWRRLTEERAGSAKSVFHFG